MGTREHPVNEHSNQRGGMRAMSKWSETEYGLSVEVHRMKASIETVIAGCDIEAREWLRLTISLPGAGPSPAASEFPLEEHPLHGTSPVGTYRADLEAWTEQWVVLRVDDGVIVLHGRFTAAVAGPTDCAAVVDQQAVGWYRAPACVWDALATADQRHGYTALRGATLCDFMDVHLLVEAESVDDLASPDTASGDVGWTLLDPIEAGIAPATDRSECWGVGELLWPGLDVWHSPGGVQGLAYRWTSVEISEHTGDTFEELVLRLVAPTPLAPGARLVAEYRVQDMNRDRVSDARRQAASILAVLRAGEPGHILTGLWLVGAGVPIEACLTHDEPGCPMHIPPADEETPPRYSPALVDFAWGWLFSSVRTAE